MKGLNNSSLPLLYEVRRDALKKSSDESSSERVFYMIHYMKMLNPTQ